MSDPRRLGAIGKSLLGLGVVLVVGLVVVTTLIGYVHWTEAQRHAASVAALTQFREQVHRCKDAWEMERRFFDRVVLSAAEPRREDLVKSGYEATPTCDGWGRALLYSRPGPIHKHGWDVWSCGPNGIDERGGGDDILIGEDLADGGSAR